MEKTNINNNLQEEASKTSIKLLESIKNAIEAYNKLNPDDKIVVNLESKYNDVSGVRVCKHCNAEGKGLNKENSAIDLFKKFKITTDDDNLMSLLMKTEIYFIYESINCKFIGIKNERYEDYRFVDVNNNRYVADCFITNEIGFDDLRLKMYSEGLIGPYQMGKATDAEMLEVLKYASEYFGLTDAKQKIK